MIEGEVDHSLLDPPYPTGLVRRVYHQPRHRRRNSRRRWGRRPEFNRNQGQYSLGITFQVSLIVHVDANNSSHRRGDGAFECIGRGKLLTSGKVPLEKTL